MVKDQRHALKNAECRSRTWRHPLHFLLEKNSHIFSDKQISVWQYVTAASFGDDTTMQKKDKTLGRANLIFIQ